MSCVSDQIQKVTLGVTFISCLFAPEIGASENQNFRNNPGSAKAGWVTLERKLYCATPDRSIYFRSEARGENIYLKVRTKSSVEVEYFLWEEKERLHTYKRVIGNAVNFPLYIEMSQLFRKDDEVLFKEQSGRVLREFPMRFTYNMSKARACQ